MIVKFIDLVCKKCQTRVAFDLSKDVVRNFVNWQSKQCPNCGTYNDLRLRQVEF